MKRAVLGIAVIATMMATLMAACGGGVPENTNLLKNTSFEEVVGDVPANWRILNFRGLRDMTPALFGVTDSVAYDGSRSFFFDANAETKRFFLLSQEVDISGARRVRVGGAIKSVAVGDATMQYPQANFSLTFYDKDRGRFSSERFADVATTPQVGTSDDWVRVERVYRVPEGAVSVAVGCVMGMSGRIYFDDVSLDVPSELPWLEHESEVFTHHYLEGHDYPEGARDYQKQLYASYAARLGIGPENWLRIRYYFYPDTASLQETVGKNQATVADYDDREIHSVNPADNHEIVHMLTHPYGVPPHWIAEGTAFYLIGSYQGESIQVAAQRLVLAGNLPELAKVFNPLISNKIAAERIIPAAASFVGYLIEFGGPEKFMALHREVNKETGYAALSASFESVYGGTLEEAEAVWIEILRTADFSKAPDSGGEE